jgi:single-strand DNA-binding protein
MNEIHCTVIGNVVTDVRVAVTKMGHRVASFRMASTTRRLNRETGVWEDLDTSFLNVTAWRSLAEHVAMSVHKGDPVTVVGRLRVREYVDAQGRSSISVDVEATSIGHDLGRGVSTFERVRRADVIPEPIDISDEVSDAA